MTLTIPRASTTRTDAQVRDAMQGIIDCNIVVTTQGTPRNRISADLVTTETRIFDLAM
jgi:hypothetical protein